MIVSQGPATISFIDRDGKEHVVDATCSIEVESAPANGTILHCGCCGLPWATVTPDGVLVVESRHGGRVHENRLSVAALAALAALASGTNGATNGETWGYSG